MRAITSATLFLGLKRVPLPVRVLAFGFGLAAHRCVVFCDEPALRRRVGAEYEAWAKRAARWIPRRRGAR